jgi:exopolyphosphatase/guanosine-5'-triphosphate,3'-diphosphate pyrophosphatase
MNEPLTEPTVAVIDLGSNSIKLLVARRDATGRGVVPLLNAVRETRVSAGISASQPSIGADAFAAGLQSVRELYETAQPFQPAVFRLVATSAVRDASNGAGFMQSIHAQTGLVGEILSGEQEARAIARGIACDPALQDKKDFFQMDLGGGSFEFVRISNGVAETAISLQLGAVRMLERFVSDPHAAIPQAQREALREHVKAELKASGFHFEPAHAPLIATGGAFTVARMCLGAPVRRVLEDTSPILGREALAELADRLSAMPLSIRAEAPFLPRQRADILPVALDTIVAAMEYAGRADCQHSLCNLRFGIAAEMLDTVV